MLLIEHIFSTTIEFNRKIMDNRALRDKLKKKKDKLKIKFLKEMSASLAQAKDKNLLIKDSFTNLHQIHLQN